MDWSTVQRRAWTIWTCVALGLTVAGCVSPIALHLAVMEYDRAANRIQAEILLLNIARSSHFEPLHFTAVSSVAATFDFQTNVGIRPTGAETTALVAPVFNAAVAERPTITIIPVEGEDFTKRILAPMDASRVAFLFQQQVEPAILLRLMASELIIRGEEKTPFLRNDPLLPEQYTEFRRRVLHLSALNLARALFVGPIVFEETFPITLGKEPGAPEVLQALDKILKALGEGYRWSVTEVNQPPVLTRRVVGRIAITNYDPNLLSNEDRRRLNEEAERYPVNSLLVDLRPGGPGGDYPMRGHFVLRSFNAIVRFLALGISAAPEFHVEKDPRTGAVPSNPPWTISIEETQARPEDAAFTVYHAGHWYSIRKAAKRPGVVFPWNQEAFRILNQLYQMTVTEVTRAPSPAITIAK